MRSLTACLFGLLVACGGGGSSSPEAKCEDLLENICGRALDCDVGFDEVDDCLAKIAESTDCGDAEKVGDSYDTCMEDIDDASCNALFPTTSGGRQLVLPSSCGTAIE